MPDRPESPVREAVEVFREEYARSFVTGVNEGDHDEAIRAGVEAVLDLKRWKAGLGCDSCGADGLAFSPDHGAHFCPRCFARETPFPDDASSVGVTFRPGHRVVIGGPESTPGIVRWKCRDCGLLHREQVVHESHSQMPFCSDCGLDVDPA